MEEKRNIKVSLEQAREWYRSGNSTLKTLALSAFKEEELQLTAVEIFEKIGYIEAPIPASPRNTDKMVILSYLSMLAEYFNSKSIKADVRYFIKGKYEGEIQIGKHAGVRYPGVVYFNNPEDLNKSIKLIGEDINLLF